MRDRILKIMAVVIKIAGHGDKKRFTVRKMSGTVGVERIFPIESPAIDLSLIHIYFSCCFPPHIILSILI